MRFMVVCLECGKRFKTANLCPVCPRCNSSDIEPAEDCARKAVWG